MEAELGPSHPSTANTLDNLAGLYKAWGQHKQAPPLHEQTLAITKAKPGPNYLSTATSSSGLADL